MLSLAPIRPKAEFQPHRFARGDPTFARGGKRSHPGEFSPYLTAARWTLRQAPGVATCVDAGAKDPATLGGRDAAVPLVGAMWSSTFVFQEREDVRRRASARSRQTQSARRRVASPPRRRLSHRGAAFNVRMHRNQLRKYRNHQADPLQALLHNRHRHAYRSPAPGRCAETRYEGFVHHADQQGVGTSLGSKISARPEISHHGHAAMYLIIEQEKTGATARDRSERVRSLLSRRSAGRRRRGEVRAFAPAQLRTSSGRRPSSSPTPFTRRPLDPRREFVCGRDYAGQFLSVTAAPTKVGKSSKSLVEAVAMAAGRNLLGVEPVRPMRDWYWNGEDPQEELERRVLAICLHYGIDRVELEKNLFLDSGRDTEIIIATQTRMGAVIAIPVKTRSPPRS
jgi:hypothetical protein